MMMNNDLLRIWNYEKNTGIDPDGLLDFEYVYSWKCPDCGYEWEEKLCRIEKRSQVYKCVCPCCTNKVVVPGINDAASYNPDMVKDWDIEGNEGKLLSEYLPGAKYHARWRCHVCGNKWMMAVVSRVKNNKGCPYCDEIFPIVGKTDLATTHPKLAAEWFYVSDIDSGPKGVTAKTDICNSWKCPECGKIYRAKPIDRVKGKGCPKCTKRGMM